MILISGKTKLLGIIGDPVEHSFSPIMHNAAIAHLGVDYVYIPFPVKSPDLAKALAGFQAIGVVGFSVTIPHKQSLFPLLTEISPAAKMIGAVNTVWWTQTGWNGTNTDITGFLSPLKTLTRDWSNITPVILGNGGAARAVVVGCEQLGCGKIRVVGRNLEKLQEFRQSWTNSGLKATLEIYNWSELPELVGDTEFLINTTPLGMYPNIEQSPLSTEAIKKIQPGAIAYDLVYNPKPTQFLKQAAQQGGVAIDGLEMLVQQGVAALEIWLKQPAPVDIMSQSLQEYLNI